MILYLKHIFVFIVVLIFFSCESFDGDGPSKRQNHKSNITLSKNERLELFLDSPFILNSNSKFQKIGSEVFTKSYILTKNPHSSIGEADSILRFATNNDIIEILKNESVERIIYLRINSEGFHLNYGIYIGMPLSQFAKLLPINVDENYVATFKDEEYFEVKFFFYRDTKKLKKIEYISLID